MELGTRKKILDIEIKRVEEILEQLDDDALHAALSKKSSKSIIEKRKIYKEILGTLEQMKGNKNE